MRKVIDVYCEDLFIQLFANELRQKREEESLSLNQLAERAVVSASFILRLEKGERKNASIEVIFKLANSLGIDLCNLIERSREATKGE